MALLALAAILIRRQMSWLILNALNIKVSTFLMKLKMEAYI